MHTEKSFRNFIKSNRNQIVYHFLIDLEANGHPFSLQSIGKWYIQSDFDLEMEMFRNFLIICNCKPNLYICIYISVTLYYMCTVTNRKYYTISEQLIEVE